MVSGQNVLGKEGLGPVTSVFLKSWQQPDCVVAYTSQCVLAYM